MKGGALTRYSFEEIEEITKVMCECSMELIVGYNIHGQQLLTVQQRILEKIKPISYSL